MCMQSKREQVNISYHKIVKLRIRADYYDDIWTFKKNKYFYLTT